MMNAFINFSNTLLTRANHNLRKLRMFFVRRKINNSNFTIICNNCVGGMIYHDMNERFNSPTINLFMTAEDYIEFIEHLEENLKGSLVDITQGNKYPIGLLNGKIRLHFMHYVSFQEALKKWNERSKRINYNNIYFLFIEREGCTYDLLKRFDQLSFKHKLAIVHKEYDEIFCSSVIPGYEKSNEVGVITYHDGYLGKRIYDRIDWPTFLQKEKNI